MIDTAMAESRLMDNKTMARLLAETADLLEIDGADSFRIRSYRRAAEAAEQTTVDLAEAAADTARLLEIDGIGKSMAAKLQAIASTGSLPQRDELLAKYGAGVLELLKLPGMGPKTVALLWDAAKIGSIDQLSQAIEAGRLDGLPRMGAKQIEKLRKGIEDYRRSLRPLPHRRGHRRGRAHRSLPIAIQRGREGHARRLVAPWARNRGRSRPAGHRSRLRARPHSGRRRICRRLSRHPRHDSQRRKQGEFPSRPGATAGSDVRLLPTASYGAALQYFTGSKAHNVVAPPTGPQNGLHPQRVGTGPPRRWLNRRRRHRRGDLRRPRHGLDAARDAREPGRN